MEEFNFKVGDKIQHEIKIVEILALFGQNRENNLFTGVDDRGNISAFYYKDLNWKLYEEPKQKQKLQKFYCGTTDELIYPEYWKTKEEALKNRKNVYTEAEFLEKFDVEL